MYTSGARMSRSQKCGRLGHLGTTCWVDPWVCSMLCGYILPADSNLDHLESKNRIRPPMLFVFVECYVFMRVLLSHCSLPVIIHVASQVCKFFMHSYVSVGNTWLTLHCRN